MDSKIDLIMRQTNYNKEEVKQKLLITEDPLQIIQEYIGTIKKEDKKITTNQSIYKEIRAVMDEASLTYRLKKEKEDEIIKNGKQTD